ncbi:copper-transporting ATPase [Bacillus canaveralius]|uniref:Copper-transporting ATPase n=2 Tax=Bacillus canaveralius TaxID=1403243 RepID=A0A2N5GL52_9BACI|nr:MULTISPECIES: cupredoxin domain-containing protein [Bacillus]PLR82242.1 copper-transporting ATPase [Bacillus canaveralius]PLR84023.1 copper-transporting ATPase [Bacillus sp. V33-4]PLR98055.1 copper-transporting ATPase [Bacillus canaveralius]
MDASNWIVTIVGLLLIGLIAWFFWGPKKGGSLAKVSSSGYQEAMIRVKNGYSPARIVVQSGKPVRFEFTREETTACSEMVVFPDFQKSAMLPVGRKIAIDLPPMKEGIYDFTCQMGMYRGKVIVKN